MPKCGGNKFSVTGVSPKWVKCKSWRRKKKKEKKDQDQKIAPYTTILSFGMAAECLKTIYRFIFLSMPCY